MAPVHRADDTASHRCRERAPTTTRASGRPRGAATSTPDCSGWRHEQHGHLPARRELPDEQQHPRVLPGLLHVDQDRPGSRDGAPLPRVAGNFFGSGRSDVLLHHGTSIQLFRNDGAGFTHTFSGVERVPGSWQFKPNDQIVVGDFNGDGVDEVVIFNGVDWVMPYLGLLVSDGAGGLKLIARYDGDIPGWGGFARNDRFFKADLNGDGKDDSSSNGDDWSMTYVGLLRSTGPAST